MRLSEKAIDYPRLVLVGAIAICIFGVVGLKMLPLERTPRVSLPLILVATPNLGASPEDNETDIVEELEENAGDLEDLDHYDSVAATGAAVIQFRFLDKADIDQAKDDVQELVNRKKRDLPSTADEPVVQDINFSDWPIIQVIIAGSDDPRRLRSIAEDLADRLEGLAGVAAADLFGGREREMQVLVNPHLMVQRGLGYEDIANAVRAANQNLPAGQTEGDRLEADVQYRGKFESAEDVRNVVVAHRPGGNVLVRDVATVIDGFKKVRTLSASGGTECVVLQVRPKADINTLKTLAQVRELVAEERERLAGQATLQLTGDTAREISIMVRQLSGSAAFGVGLVVVVLWIFMGLRNAMLISFAIPFSILFAFAILFVVKLTIDDEAAINNMVLFGLILIIGMVVDGALIVGENIYRHVEGGMANRRAAQVGIREVGAAVISADLTTIAAFVPMLMVSGIMGAFLRLMPIVVAMALAASMMVDHFLLPVIARYVMRAGKGRFAAAVGEVSAAEAAARSADHVTIDSIRRSADAARLARPYGRVIRSALRHRVVTLIVTAAAVAVAVSAIALGLVGFEFFPKSDLAMFRINYEMPAGTPIDQTLAVGKRLAAAVDDVARPGELQSEPVVTVGEPGVFAAALGGAKTGSEYGTILVELVLADKRDRSTRQIVADYRDHAPDLPQVKEIRIEEMKEGPPGGAALVVRLRSRGQSSVDDLGQMSERLAGALRRTPGARDVTCDWLGQRKIRVRPKRQVAAMAGVSDGQVSLYESYALNGLVVSDSNFGTDESIDIRVQNLPEFRDRESLRNLPIRGAGGQVRDLGEVAEVDDDVLAPYAIFHRDGTRVVNLRCEAQEGYIADQIRANFLDELAKAGLPPAELARRGFAVEFGGENEERDQAMKDLSWAWILGLLLILIILVVQFNSFIQPVVVLTAIPLSFVGVIIGLVVLGYNFSIATMIGVVALAGIVVNDAIVLVTFVNQLRAAGFTKHEALVRAGQLRLRPIFLTTVTTIVGLLPLAMDLTGGGAFWRPLTTAIMFGLACATALTLAVIPVSYSLLVPEGRRARASQEASRPGQEEEGPLPA